MANTRKPIGKRRTDMKRTNFRITDATRRALEQHFADNVAKGVQPTGYQQLWDLMVAGYLEAAQKP